MGLRGGTVLLVVNPAAKRGHGAEYGLEALRLLRSELGVHALDVANTDYRGHGAELAREAAGYHAVVALGGDGLVHEVANGLMSIPGAERPAMGVIPVGSGNDYARSLEMPRKVGQAVRALLDAEERPLDVGCCNGEYFVETLSFGLDAGVALGTELWRHRLHIAGALLYLASGIDQMLNHRKVYRFEAELDAARKLAGEMLLMAVQIGPTYGGGFRICPQARLDDGVFEICHADAPGLAKTAFVFLRAKNGGHVGYPEVHFERASSLRLEFDGRPPAQIDGEPLTADAYDIQMHHRALRVMLPSAKR